LLEWNNSSSTLKVKRFDLALEVFKCKKCGNCCKDLFDFRRGEKRGLTLTTQEAALFSDKEIAPLAAFGFDSPNIIFLYQLSVKDCPHINIENHCTIYEKRPLICRAFPLTEGSFSTKCKLFWFLKDFPENTVKVVIDWGKTQLEAEKQLDDYIIATYKSNFAEGLCSWSFDLDNGKWKLIKKYRSINEIIEF
jgi:Fe-S-cluster containining protein